MHTDLLRLAGQGLLGLVLLTTACGSDEDASRAGQAEQATGPEAPPAGSLLDAGVVADASQADGGTSDAAVPQGCQSRLPPACPSPPTRYADIVPVVSQRCVEPCHSPRWTGPWPLDAYEHVADWADSIRVELLNCTMPPPDAGIPITTDERNLILSWIRCGIPR